MKPEFYTYDREQDIHYIDYSGVINWQTGLQRLEKLEVHFRKWQIPGKPLKILMDARTYRKYSPEVHDRLAKKAREVFRKKFLVKLAVLDANYACQLSDDEAWFTELPAAIAWLK